jgi:hypothetical protein
MADISGRFLQLKAISPMLVGQTWEDRIAADANGALWVSIKGAAYVPVQGASADKIDMFKQRAQSIISGPFGCLFGDFVGAQTDMGTGGFGAVSSQAQITSGRGAAGSRGLLTVGAGGNGFETYNSQNVNGTSSATIVNLADMASDAWYLETIVNVLTLTGNSEILLPCLWQNAAGTPAVTDAGSPPFTALTINAGVSTGFWVLKCNSAAGAQTVITTIPIEFGTTRHIGYGHDGWGTLYTMRDGVIFDRIQQFNNAQHVPGTLGYSWRGLAGTATLQIDALALAGMYI